MAQRRATRAERVEQRRKEALPRANESSYDEFIQHFNANPNRKKLTPQILADLEILRSWSAAKSDPLARTRLLQLFADRIRKGVPLPPAVAHDIARAFDAAADASTERQARVLADGLRLKFDPFRPVEIADRDRIGMRFDELVSQPMPATQAKSVCATEFGISESSALRIGREYRRRRNALMDSLGGPPLIDGKPLKRLLIDTHYGLMLLDWTHGQLERKRSPKKS